MSGQAKENFKYSKSGQRESRRDVVSGFYKEGRVKLTIRNKIESERENKRIWLLEGEER